MTHTLRLVLQPGEGGASLRVETGCSSGGGEPCLVPDGDGAAGCAFLDWAHDAPDALGTLVAAYDGPEAELRSGRIDIADMGSCYVWRYPEE